MKIYLNCNKHEKKRTLRNYPTRSQKTNNRNSNHHFVRFSPQNTSNRHKKIIITPKFQSVNSHLGQLCEPKFLRAFSTQAQQQSFQLPKTTISQKCLLSKSFWGSKGMIKSFNSRVPNDTKLKIWNKGVPIENEAIEQLRRLTEMSSVLAVRGMPDLHVGIGAAVGAVIATQKAIIPSAVGVDIGCGMIATKTDLHQNFLPDSLKAVRLAIEEEVPHGNDWWRGNHKKRQISDKILKMWDKTLAEDFDILLSKHPKGLGGARSVEQLGTLGGGNHFIEVCLDEDGFVWFMIHSGSRGVGNLIGRYFIELAKNDMKRLGVRNLGDENLAYLTEGTEFFDDYMFAVEWAQRFAKTNREIMMANVIRACARTLPPFKTDITAVNCHHNYVQTNYIAPFLSSDPLYITRKGAIHAPNGQLAIIPGSMGAKSYIVRGKGNLDSLESCSHGAGRVLGRREARKCFNVKDLLSQTKGVECRKDLGVIDEAPAAYKSIDAVIEAQDDLIEVVHTLKQIVCVKG